LAPLLRAVLPLPFEETEATRSLDDEARRRRLFDLVTQLIASAARARPLTVVFEDVHWSDRSSLQLLIHVTGELGSDRVIVLLTARTLDGVDLSPAGDRLRMLALGELSEGGALQLVRSILGLPSLHPQIASALMAKARGNPLFLAEVARSLRQSGELDRLLGLPEHQLVEALGALEIPDRVQTLIMSRIDALSSVTKEVLRGASVLGASFDGASVRALLEADVAGGGLARNMAELADTDLIEAEGEDRFRFAHALIQDVAYESLLYSRRRNLHQRAGSYFEVLHWQDPAPVYETLVYHYLRAGNRPRALLYSVLAGNKARGVFANDEAIEHYERAADLSREAGSGRVEGARPVDVSAGSIHTNLADILELTGSHGDAVRHYGRALALIGAPSLSRVSLAPHRAAPKGLVRRARQRTSLTRKALANICRKVGSVHERLSDYRTAQAWFLSALSVLPANSPVERCRACMGMAIVQFRAGEFSEARDWCVRGLRNARQGDDPEEVAHAYNGLGTIDYAQGFLRRAVGYHMRALAIYEEIGDLRGGADTLNNLAIDHYDLGEWSLATQRYQECLEMATKTGDVDTLAVAHNNLGELFLHCGDIARAKSEFRWTIEARTRVGNIGISALAESNLGESLMLEGGYGEARRCLENSLRDFRQIRVPAFEASVNVRLAALNLAEGATDEAQKIALRALSMARKLSVAPIEEAALLVLGKIAIAREDWTGAETRLLRSMRLAMKAGNRHGEAKAKLWLGKLYLKAPAGCVEGWGQRRATAHLRKAKTILESLGARLDLETAEESLSMLQTDG
jgi:tetratricopeptide (TPR) repeat protein